MHALSLLELILAARCPRQLALVRVYGANLVDGGVRAARAVHDALVYATVQAPRSAALLAALRPSPPDEEAVAAAVYRLAYRKLHEDMVQLARHMDADDLMQADAVLRSVTKQMAVLLTRARGAVASAEEAIQATCTATEETIRIRLDEGHIEDRVGPVQRDVTTGDVWWWDLSRHAGTHRAQLLHLKSMAVAFGHRGSALVAGLYPVQGEESFVVRAAQRMDDDVEQLRAQLAEIREWLEPHATPPPATELTTCPTCPVQDACWTRWGRTLPDLEEPSRPPPAAPPSGKRAPLATTPTVPKPVQLPEAPLSPSPLWLGDDRGRQDEARLEPSDLEGHIAVIGARGSGKSELVRAIVEEAALDGTAVLVLDIHGDLAQLAALQPSGLPAMQARAEAFARRVQVRLVTPASDAGLRMCLQPLHAGSESRAPDRGEELCRAVVAEELVAMMRIPEGWQLLAREYLAQVLAAPAAGADLACLARHVLEPGGLRGEPLLRSRTRREALAEQLRAIGAGPHRFLYEHGRPFEPDRMVERCPSGQSPVHVVWLPALGDLLVRQRYATALLARIYRWMLHRPADAPGLLVAVDDAAALVPPHGDAASKRVVTRVLAEGRDHGVRLLLCSWSYAEADASVITMAETIAAGRIAGPHEKSRVRKVFPGVEGFDALAAANLLAGAVRGRFLVSNSRGFHPPRPVQVRTPLTLHAPPWSAEQIAAHVVEEDRAWWDAPSAAS